MLDMVQNPLMTMFDQDFLLYAGSDILSKTLVAFFGIWMACTLFDLVTDRDTRPSRRHLLIRGLLAFFVPLAFIFITEQANTMPSSYRVYRPGSYEIGKTLPAGTYSVSGTGPSSSLAIEGEDGKISQQWTRGSMSVTVYDGDTLTLDGCTARNRTATLTYNANAGTSVATNGGIFLLGGAELRPGTYEITPLTEESEYEVRDSYLTAGSPLDATEIDGVAYADIHYGEVLYAKDATIVLYSNVFALPKPAEDGSEATGEKDEADGTEATEAEDKDADGEGQEAEAEEGTTGEDKATDEKADEEDGKGDEASQAEGDGKGEPKGTVENLVRKVNDTPWTRGHYAPVTALDGFRAVHEVLEGEPADTEEPPSFHDLIRRAMV